MCLTIILHAALTGPTEGKQESIEYLTIIEVLLQREARSSTANSSRAVSYPLNVSNFFEIQALPLCIEDVSIIADAPEHISALFNAIKVITAKPSVKNLSIQLPTQIG